MLRLQGSVPLLTLSSSPNLVHRVSDGQHSWDFPPFGDFPFRGTSGASRPGLPAWRSLNRHRLFDDFLARLPGFVLRESPLHPPVNRLPPDPPLGFLPLQGSTSPPARIRLPGSLLPCAWIPVGRRAPCRFPRYGVFTTGDLRASSEPLDPPGVRAPRPGEPGFRCREGLSWPSRAMYDRPAPASKGSLKTPLPGEKTPNFRRRRRETRSLEARPEPSRTVGSNPGSWPRSGVWKTRWKR